MTQQQPPRRYATGGFTGAGDSSMRPQRDGTEHTIPRELAERMEARARAFGIEPGMVSIVVTLTAGAMLEATARSVTLGLVREFGVTLPLRAFRKRPKPLTRLESMVLAKLEGVAEHLGTP